MAAREKMKKAERVPDAMMAKFNAARADFLETVQEANKRLAAFQAECQKAVSEAREAMAAQAKAIGEAMKLDAAKGDKFDVSTGLIKRAEAAK